MADHELQTTPPSKGIVFKLRYDTITNWMNSDLILKQGEAAIAAFPNTSAYQPPKAVGIKIGDGRHYFDELPWIQALAADVYSWAKASTPPSADTIPGLNQYIQDHAPSSGGGSAGSGAYQIIWDANSSKYILQQWNEQEQDWDDTASEIDFSSVLTRINNIERWANGATTNLGNIYDPIGAIVYDEVIKYINKMDVADTAVAHQFVTAVTQVDGKIQITRSIIRASDITDGVLSTAQGGTGLSRLENDEVMVGSNNGTITTRTFVTTIDPSDRNSFVTAGAIIDYVARMTAGLTGAMHFVGEATVPVPIDSRTDPQIVGYNFRDAESGDVILANEAQELVWTGSEWRLLGDEGSYAIKGSITNVDIIENANIAQSKIAGLTEALDGKVDAVEGKQLSTNDFDAEAKQKLDDIEEGAQVNVIEHVFLNDEEVQPTTVSGLRKSIDLHFNGMTPEQGEKLDGIEAGAQVNTIEQIQLNSTPVPAVNGVVNLEVREFTEQDAERLATVQENVIEHIYVDGAEVPPDQDKIVSIQSNPHTEHINKIEHILVNGQEFLPQTINNVEKTVNLLLDDTVLDLNAIIGARYPTGVNTYADIEVFQKKLELSHLAATGDVQHLLQTPDTYIIIDCGSSTDVI